jgi:oxaloacetate decarboxylase alpha subunit
MLDATDRSTGLDIELLEDIANYFREIRKKYAKFEGSLRGIDSRILVAQVPGGMLTNLENQLREQNATDKMDEVLEEIPKVRKDLGYIPLVTPTSQIVGTQAVLNVLVGERYKTITKETQGVLKGEYGATPAPMNAELQSKVLDGAEAITCRPADLLKAEFEAQKTELLKVAKEEGITLANEVDDTLTYALFPQAGLKFLKNRNNPDAFEPMPTIESAAPSAPISEPGVYTVELEGAAYIVKVTEGGDISQFAQKQVSAPVAGNDANVATSTPPPDGSGTPVPAPLAGNVFRVVVAIGDEVAEGDVILVLEAMKIETEIRSPSFGTVTAISVAAGDAVKVGDSLLSLG